MRDLEYDGPDLPDQSISGTYEVTDPARIPASSPVFTISEGRAVIRLNRPEHHNRIEPADIEVLRQLLVKVEEDDTVRVLVLTGTGTTFCAGYDLATLAAAGPTADRRQGSESAHEFEQLVDELDTCRVPTICSLNGPVYGGGADLALACDFRVGVATAHMAIPASQLGVHYYHGGLRRFVTRLGLGAAKRLLLLSEHIDAAEMLRIGFLDEIVPTIEALQERVDEIAGTLAAVPVPEVLVGMKRALNRIGQGDMDSRATDAAWTQSVRSPTAAVAAKAWLAARRKRPTEIPKE